MGRLTPSPAGKIDLLGLQPAALDAPNLADGEAVMRVQNEGLKPE